ncbi:efflux RND transporter periplasmic adaptor subunit [Endothiovibrio diazotrophicus]
MRRKIALLAAVVGVGVAAIWGYQAYGARYPSTDDAYIGADVVRVAARVAGRVEAVQVVDQQRVRRGELLFAISPDTFRFAVREAEAQLALARREVAQAQAAVVSAGAEVHHREVLRENARAKAERARHLVKQDYLSHQGVEDAEAEFNSVEANLEVARAGLDEARRRLGAAGDDNDRVVAAKAALDRARWQLDNTRVSAACDGQVSQVKLRPGDVVGADDNVFVLICAERHWVEANFKETQLARIAPGQPVDVVVDMYPGHHFAGRVESVSGAAGAVFSLLPPQNASGNWVKVTQRVPVRIRLEAPDPAFPLRVGTSTEVTVDTTVKKAFVAGRETPPRT